MPSRSEIKVLETLTAALSCCEMVKLFHSESQHKAESAQELLKDILSQYRYRLSVSEVKKVSEKIIYICDIKAVWGSPDKSGKNPTTFAKCKNILNKFGII